MTDLRSKPMHTSYKIRFPLTRLRSFMKDHMELAELYYDQKCDIAGRELAHRARMILGYSKNTYWWDMIKNKEDIYRKIKESKI